MPHPTFIYGTRAHACVLWEGKNRKLFISPTLFLVNMPSIAFNETKWKELPLVQILFRMQTEQKNDNEAWNAIKAAGRHIAPLIEKSPFGLEHLTSHDVGHCYRIALRIGQILPRGTDLNRGELFTLLCAIIYHDIGLFCYSDGEIDQSLKNEKFQRFVNTHFETLFGEIKQLHESEEPEKRIIGSIELIRLISRWKRSVHPDISAEILRKHARSDGSEGQKVIPEELAEVAARIIETHGWSTKEVLRDSRLKGRLVDCFGSEDFVNLRYLSVLLRLGDLLDVGKNRVPKIIKKNLGEELLPLESEAHWIKEEKLWITDISPDTVKVEGIFDLVKEVEREAYGIAKEWSDSANNEIKSLRKICSKPRDYGQDGKIKRGIGKLKKLDDNILTQNTIRRDVKYISPNEIALLEGYYDSKLWLLRKKVEDIEKYYLKFLSVDPDIIIESLFRETKSVLAFFIELYHYPSTKALSINEEAYEIFEKYIRLCNEIFEISKQKEIVFIPKFPYLRELNVIVERGKHG